MLRPVYLRGSHEYAERADGTVFEREWVFVSRVGVWGWGPWHLSPMARVPKEAVLTKAHKARLPKG